MENRDDSSKVAEAARIARDDTQDDDARCSAIRALSEIISSKDAAEKEVSDAIRICATLIKGEPMEVQNAALQALDQTIQDRAKIVVKGARSTMAKDFVGMSAGLIFERIIAGSFDPENAGSFRGWCYTVLRNEWISQIRKRKTDAIGHMETPNLTDQAADNANDLMEDNRPIHDQSIDLRALRDDHFEREDMEILEGWKPQNRLVLLTLSGLWRKVPSDVWTSWLIQLSIAPPFPPHDFADLKPQQKRYQVVAKSLQASFPDSNEINVKQKWYRLVQSLAELSCVARLK